MILVWGIVYLIAELFGNPTVHIDPWNFWGVSLILSLAFSVGSAK